METIFDLPAHPLMVHAPVVLLPLTLLLLLVLAVRPGWRQQAGWAIVLASGATFVTSLVAKLSGEAFDEALNKQFTVDRSAHEDLGDQTVLLVFVLLITSLIVAALDFRSRRSGGGGSSTAAASPMAGHIAMVVTVLVAVVATIWMIRTGHEGAKLVHEGRI